MFMDNIYWILWESQPSISLELNNGALFRSFRPPVRGEHPLPCPFGGKVPLEAANLCVKSGPTVKFHTLPETNGQSPRKPRKPLCQRNPFSGAKKPLVSRRVSCVFGRKIIQNAIDTIFGIQELGYDMKKTTMTGITSIKHPRKKQQCFLNN